MKANLLSILIIFTSLLSVQGQNSEFEIKLKSEKITPEVMFDFEQELKPRIKELSQEHIYRIIQFYTIPTSSEKKRITEKGIKLLGYLPNKAFYARIPNSISNADLRQLNIRSILVLQDHHKMSTELTAEKFPKWAIRGDDVLLNVSYFSQEDKSKLLNSLAQEKSIIQGGGLVMDDVEKINMITIQYSKSKIKDLVKNPFVQWVELVPSPPVPHSTEGLSTTRSNAINTEYVGGRKYDGSGVVVGVSDDGLVGPHIDLHGRVTQHTDENDGNHGDMTSGIVAGAGNLDPTRKAMAPGVDINIYRHSQTVFLNSQTHITEAVANFNDLGTIITSTSFGGQADGAYNNTSQFVDVQLNETPILAHVFSAGNAGILDTGYGAGAGWGNINMGFQVGKNVIAVGNLDVNDQIFIASSRGPAADGRIKPDICALGDGHWSTDENNTYQRGTGTSAATPAVAGAVAQLYQAYKEHNNGTNPESGLIKAALLNTAEDLGNPGPDFQYGWGKINSLKAARIIEDKRYINESIEQGENKNHIISVPDNVSQVRFMTYWADVAGSPVSAVNLVNDINMEVVTPDATTYDPWILDPTPDPAALDAPATRGVDHLNNMEQVTLDNPLAGDYTVNLNGFAIPEGPQSYFVVYDFIFDEVELTYPLGGEGFVPNEVENIKWDASRSTEPFDLEYSIDGGNSFMSMGTSAANTKSFAWTVPNTISGEVKVRISRGNSISESDTTFTIAQVPTNLNIVRVCPDTVELAWNPVADVSMYEISMLGEKYMDSIGVSTTNSFIVTGLNPNEDDWFSVRSLVSENKGRRAIAINKPPGTVNCILNNDLELLQILTNLENLSGCEDLKNTEISVRLNNPALQETSGASLNVQVDNGAVVTEQLPIILQPGENTDYTFIADMSSGLTDGEISIWVTMENDQNLFNDTLVTSYRIFNISATVINDFPHFEGFQTFDECITDINCEQDECILELGWSNLINNDEDDIDWRTDSDGTATSNTGPIVDYDNGTATGKYLYLEATSCDGKEAIMTSPCIDLTDMLVADVEFAYHMRGNNIGELHVDIITEDGEFIDVVNPIIGDQGDAWQLLKVDLTPYIGGIINLRIRGVLTFGSRGDIAIDAFTFNANSDPTSTDNQDDLASRIEIYPNPTNGYFTISFPPQLVNQSSKVKIVNGLGRSLLDFDIKEELTVDIPEVESGILFVMVYGENIKVVKKLIKL